MTLGTILNLRNEDVPQYVDESIRRLLGDDEPAQPQFYTVTSSSSQMNPPTTRLAQSCLYTPGLRAQCTTSNHIVMIDMSLLNAPMKTLSSPCFHSIRSSNLLRVWSRTWIPITFSAMKNMMRMPDQWHQIDLLVIAGIP